MESLGTNGLFQVIGFSHLTLAVYITYRMLRRSAPEETDTADFQNMPVTLGQTAETYNLDPRSDAETYMADEEEEALKNPDYRTYVENTLGQAEADRQAGRFVPMREAMDTLKAKFKREHDL